ncbi:MAG: hypothetical protein JNM94_12620 [Phycisphaerae bacterium]|nr:hypothetical protein [Phycisphaerae bacterium]
MGFPARLPARLPAVGTTLLAGGLAAFLATGFAASPSSADGIVPIRTAEPATVARVAPVREAPRALVYAARDPVVVRLPVEFASDGVPTLPADAARTLAEAALANPARLILIDLAGASIAYHTNDGSPIRHEDADRHELALAAALESTIKAAKAAAPNAILSVSGLPAEREGDGRTNLRYAPVIGLLDVLSPRAGLLVAGGDSESTRVVQEYRASARLSAGRPIAFKGGDGWRLAVAPPKSKASSNASSKDSSSPAHGGGGGGGGGGGASKGGGATSGSSTSLAGGSSSSAPTGQTGGGVIPLGDPPAGTLAAGDSEASDLSVVLESWGTTDGDQNGDGTTDGQDLTAVLASLSLGLPGPNGNGSDNPTGGGGEGGGGGGGGDPPAGGDGPFLAPGPGFTDPTPEPPAQGDPTKKAADERAIARWSIVPYQTVTADFNVGVVADHYNDILKVDFSVDGGPWVATTTRRVNPQTNVPEFYATMRIADFNDGLHEIRARVYPKDGLVRVLGGPIIPNRSTGNHSLFVSTNRDGTLPVKTVWVANDGSDTDGDGTESKPYLTLHYAGHALANKVAGGDAGGGVMYLKAGSYNLGTYSYAKRFSSPTRYITLQPAPGVKREDVLIVSSSQDGLRTDLVHFHNLSIRPAVGAQYPIRNVNNQGIAWFDECHFQAQNFDDTSTLNWYLGWAMRYFTECSAYYVRGTPYSGHLVRNSSIEFVADDAFKNIFVILNCTVKDLGPHNTSIHSDVWQVWNTNALVQNCYVDNLVATESIDAQGLFFHGFTLQFLDCAYRNVTIDNTNNGTASVFVNLHMHRPVKHLLIRNSTLVGGGLYRTGDDPSKPEQSHNIFSGDDMLMEETYKEAAKINFVVPPPDGPSQGNQGSWPGTLPWTSPLGVHYRKAGS